MLDHISSGKKGQTSADMNETFETDVPISILGFDMANSLLILPGLKESGWIHN